MNSTSVNSQTSLTPTATGSKSSAGLSSAASTLAQLLCDIDSGRISAAQQDLATLNRQLGATQNGAAVQNGGNRSQFGKLLNVLGVDLGAGNLEAAQSAVQSFFASLQIGTLTGPIAVAAASDAAPVTVGSGQLSEQFSALIQSIQAGDLGEARNAYNGLVNRLTQSRPNASATGKTRSNIESTAAAQPASLQNLIPKIGDALSSGNLAVAQQNLQAFVQTGIASGGNYAGTSA